MRDFVALPPNPKWFSQPNSGWLFCFCRNFCVFYFDFFLLFSNVEQYNLTLVSPAATGLVLPEGVHLLACNALRPGL